MTTPSPLINILLKKDSATRYTAWCLMLLSIVLFLSGCQSSDSEKKDLGSIAKLGNGGTLDGPYSLRRISVRDVNGGSASFGYGAVNGYPGATADIGGIGVPKHITGYWAKENPDGPGFESYYRISADIDSDLAEKKVRTLQNYYQHFQRNWGFMRVAVDKSRIVVLYTQGCYDHDSDCTPKENADPQGYVTQIPANSIDLVSLFDGHGEASVTPFPGSPYDKRSILIEPFELSHKLTFVDVEGKHETSRSIGDLVRVYGHWRRYQGKDSAGKLMFRYFQIDTPIDTQAAKEKIEIMRAGLAHKSFGTATYTHIDENGLVKIYYRMYCQSEEICDDLEKSRNTTLVQRPAPQKLDILLFEGQANELDAPPVVTGK